MSQFEKLLPIANQPIFDHEELTRQLLFNKIADWLRAGFMSVIPLKEIRLMVMELQGIEPLRSHMPDIPAELDRAHCVNFLALTEVNRRKLIEDMLAYVGITPENQIDILGVSRWGEIQKTMDLVIAGISLPSSTSSQLVIRDELDNWTRVTLRSEIMNLLKSNRFSIVDFDRLMYAIRHAREAYGFADVDHRKTVQYAGLRALHCVDFDDMDNEVLVGIPQAILNVLGLSDEEGTKLFGQAQWIEISKTYHSFAASRNDLRQRDDDTAGDKDKNKSLLKRVLSFFISGKSA